MKTLLFLLLPLCAVAQQTATVTINTGKVLHKVAERDYHGVNLVALWNDTGIDTETRRAYEQAGFGLLRFPGGVPCQWYDWKEPLATGWTTMTPQNVWDFAKAGRSKMLFQTNTATDKTDTNKDTGKPYSFNSSGSHAAEWVSAMKKAGVGVAFWEIGNEPEIDAPNDIKSKGQDAIYEWYNAKFKEQVAAMKKADPQARFMGPASCNTWFWWAQNNLAKFLKAHGNKTGDGLVDAISLHWYPEGGNGSWQDKRGLVQTEWPKAMDFIKKTIAEHDSRNLPLYITEWNWGGGDKNESAADFANALGTADAIGMFLRTGVSGHTFFCLQRIQKNWGVLAMKSDNRPWHEASPTYYALVLSAMLGGEVLETTTADEANVMSAYATRSADRVTSVMLINKTDAPIDVQLDWKGVARPLGSAMQLYTLEADSPTARDVTWNGVKSPTPWKSALPPPKILQGAINLSKLKLAPYSVTLLRAK